MVGLGTLAAIRAPVNYLRLPYFERHHLQSMFGYLKKHLDIQGLSEASMAVLRAIQGVNIAMADGGYFVSMTGTFIPPGMVQPSYLVT